MSNWTAVFAVAVGFAVATAVPAGATPEERQFGTDTRAAMTRVADDPPVITSFGCFSELRGRFSCSVSYVGGLAPVSIRWSPGAGFWDNRTSVSGACIPGQNMTVSVRVISASGIEAADSDTFACRSGNP